MMATQTAKKRLQSGGSRAAQFKKSGGRQELTLPSGYTVEAKRIDLRILLKTGKIPNVLRPILDRAMQGLQTSPEELSKKVAESPEALDDVLEFMDTVWLGSVSDPVVGVRPENKEDESEDVVYTDEVDIEDKIFVVNWSMGGANDLERFREEQSTTLERVRASEGDEHPAEPTG
jgi:hypothetical protein